MCSANHSDVVSLFTNHPKVGDIVAFNQALCGLYAAGLGRGIADGLRKSSVATIPAVSSPVETHNPIPAAASATGDHAVRNRAVERRSLQRARAFVRRCSRSRLRDLPRPEGSLDR